MGALRLPLVLVSLFLCCADASGQTEEFQIYQEHPRLLLTSQRLRLLKRERERQSQRWQQWETLLRAGAPAPEPGFTYALAYQVTGVAEWGRKAISWAQTGTDLRQLALVFDWCQPLLSRAEADALQARLQSALQRAPAATDPASARNRVLAAVALADHAPESATVLRAVVEGWWQQKMIPALKNGREALPRNQIYAQYELLHAVRDTLQLDLREGAGAVFEQLPVALLLSYYPAPLPSPENDFHVPAYSGRGEPDLKQAALSRAAELAIVAYDTNAQVSQFVQGWANNDRFVMRGTFGAPYEFLWANPYQPGLTFTKLPLSWHDPANGRLYIRSSWDEDASWLGGQGTQFEQFVQGRRRDVPSKSLAQPVIVGSTAVVSGQTGSPVKALPPAVDMLYLVGLAANQRVGLEIEDQELELLRVDAGGILALPLPAGSGARWKLLP